MAVKHFIPVSLSSLTRRRGRWQHQQRGYEESVERIKHWQGLAGQGWAQNWHRAYKGWESPKVQGSQRLLGGWLQALPSCLILPSPHTFLGRGRVWLKSLLWFLLQCLSGTIAVSMAAWKAGRASSCWCGGCHEAECGASTWCQCGRRGSRASCCGLTVFILNHDAVLRPVIQGQPLESS